MKTALLPAPDCPATVVFQPDPLPVASATPKFVIVVFVVWADPFSVIALSVGIAGVVENDREPAVTENCVLSSAVAAAASAGARHPKAPTETTKAISRRIRLRRSGRGAGRRRERLMEVIVGLQSGGPANLAYHR